ncbi:WD40 repeat-like-containing domain-containing protein [Pochonia chlamydosporia 170]|uniref:WD40 repeat-like-containing domain-containing protein n=1 Tax=Pochonia chlamydosporia 170 TaxID=1380566 RepID=A0A179FM21_METCM|nr:WD40 repeat-like-containing domain-containing protein [Pochonia chlamydosporia 170]OAQ66622.1 WD40 repeat-like-containing domain-containing protein [Pochonia chlamydosporia 170]
MDNVPLAASAKRLVLDLPPSCMQFSPIDSSYFVVGTYNLHRQDPSESEPESQTQTQQAVPEATENDVPETESATRISQSRSGSLIIKVQAMPQPSALLDLRFHPHHSKHQGIFAVVSSTGTLAIYRLNTENNQPLEHVATSRCSDLGEDVLFLQCNWHPSVENVIAVTTSTGLARVFYLNGSWAIKDWVDVDVQNTLEAWSVCLSNPDSSNGDERKQVTVYCGGDDSILRYTSLSLGQSNIKQNIETEYPPISIKGPHNAGVTAILPLSAWTPAGWRIVITGSYDDQLRVFAVNDPHESYGAKMVQLLTEIDLGGGVWRLNLIDMKVNSLQRGSVYILLLASCMHAGPRVVEVVTDDGQTWRCSVLARFEEHQSMNYAADCLYNHDKRSLTCVSTSFYDRLMCLWTCDL